RCHRVGPRVLRPVVADRLREVGDGRALHRDSPVTGGLSDDARVDSHAFLPGGAPSPPPRQDRGPCPGRRRLGPETSLTRTSENEPSEAEEQMGLLDGKVAIVTGAGHGVGRGEALELANEGAKVVVNDLGGSVTGEGADKRPAEEVADLIRSRGGAAVANYDDVADYAGAKNIIDQAISEFGKLDVGVNNAGI